jgi:hypothetical protein
MAAAAMVQNSGGPPVRPQMKVVRPVRRVVNRNPILWAGSRSEDDWQGSEYTQKYKEYDHYQRLQMITHAPQIPPSMGKMGEKPSTYTNDYIPSSTYRPVQHRAPDTLDFWNEYTAPVTSYNESYITQPRSKRDAIARIGDHWIKAPPGFDGATTQKDSYPLHYEYSRRATTKRDVPYQPPNVSMTNQTTHLSDFLWKHESPRDSFRPQAPAVIPAPFDGESTNRETYVPHAAHHYSAAFADLSLLEPRSARPQPVDGELVLPKKGGKPASPSIPDHIMAEINSSRKPPPKSSLNARLEALKATSPRHPQFSTTYGRSYETGKDSFRAS